MGEKLYYSGLEGLKREIIHHECIFDFCFQKGIEEWDIIDFDEHRMQYCQWIVESLLGYCGEHLSSEWLFFHSEDMFFAEQKLTEAKKVSEKSSAYDVVTEFTEIAQESVTHFLGDELCDRLTNQIIRDLQKNKKDLLSGNDSGLINVWDEICVQVQTESSFHWEFYMNYIEQITQMRVNRLKWHEIVSVALISEEYVNEISSIMNLKDPSCLGGIYSFREEYPASFFIDMAIDQIVNRLLSKANNYTNSRIEKGVYGY